MTTVITKPLGFDLNRRYPARSMPASPMMRKPTRKFPAISQHVPVTPRNRIYLRALRQAEMEAWHAVAQIEPSQAAEKERRDLRAFGLIALMAVTVVAISFWKSHALVEQWAGVVHAVQQWIH